MTFDAGRFSEAVRAILAIEGGGARPMPLTFATARNEHARAALAEASARELFPGARAPEAALAGLWLYYSFMDEAHGLAQDIETPDGSYWHGIVHRREPDPANAAYWFRRVGTHPTYAALHAAVVQLGSGIYRLSSRWDPFAFIDFTEQARRQPKSAEEELAARIQLLEWQILFDHCASSTSHK